jgi:hypothetical protein
MSRPNFITIQECPGKECANWNMEKACCQQILNHYDDDGPSNICIRHKDTNIPDDDFRPVLPDKSKYEVGQVVYMYHGPSISRIAEVIGKSHADFICKYTVARKNNRPYGDAVYVLKGMESWVDQKYIYASKEEALAATKPSFDGTMGELYAVAKKIAAAIQEKK